MNSQSLLIFVGALVLVGGGGCRPSAYEPSTQAKAQGTNDQMALRDAMSLATDALSRLRRQALNL